MSVQSKLERTVRCFVFRCYKIVKYFSNRDYSNQVLSSSLVVISKLRRARVTDRAGGLHHLPQFLLENGYWSVRHDRDSPLTFSISKYVTN